MKKNLLSLVVGATMLVPTLGFAVGLGSVRTYSHLNEKLRAEIPVLSVKQKGKMTVALASNAEFANRGVQRSDVLNDLSFSLVERKGRTYVNVSSKKQIVAPYLNFILRLQTPEGVVSREYAIFLDPIETSKKKSVTKSSSLVTPYRSSRTQKNHSTKPASPAPRNAAKSSVPAKASVNVADTKGVRYGPIRRRETLWSIAKHTRPSASVPVADMVRAIRRANPRTLANGLPAGVMITIPTISGYPAYSGGYAPMPQEAAASKKKSVEAKKPQNVTQNSVTATPATQKKQPAKTVAHSQNTTAGNSLADELPKSQELVTDNVEVKNQALETTAVKLGNAISSGLSSAAESVDNQVASMTDSVKETTNDLVDGTVAIVEDMGNVSDNVVENSVASGEDPVTADLSALPNTLNEAVNEVVATDNTVAPAPAEIKPEIKPVETSVEKPTETEPQILPQTPPQKTAVSEPKKPTIVAKAPQPAPEPSMMDKVIDYAPFLGGGAAAALLAGYVFMRRRKAKQEVVPLTDDDMAALLGEEDLDDFEALEGMDDFSDETVKNAEDAAEKMLADVDNVGVNVDDVAGDDIDELDNWEDLNDLDDISAVNALEDLSEEDLSEVVVDDADSLDDSALVGADLRDDALDEVSDTLAGAIDFSDDEALAEADLDADISEFDDMTDNGFAFELDGNDGDIFDTNVKEAVADDFIADNSVSFDLTDGDDDLFAELKDDVSLVSEATTDSLEEMDFSVDALQKSLPNKESDEDSAFINTDDGKVISEELRGGAISKNKEATLETVSRMQMKLDLATSFISISEHSRAKELLAEIIADGSDEQVSQAQKLLEDLA